MMLFLAHHGETVGSGVDPRRPLSDLGQTQVDSLANLAAARAVRPEVIWHSGKLRARQTAEAYWRACNPLAGFSATRWMQPDDPLVIADQLEAETRDVLLVGHMPHLDRLLRRLLGETPDVDCFPQNGLVAIDRTETGWEERWRLVATRELAGFSSPKNQS